jgi:hypothetical protein
MTDSLSQRPHSNLFHQFFNDGIDIHFAHFAFFTTAQGNGIILGFLCSDNNRLRDLSTPLHFPLL